MEWGLRVECRVGRRGRRHLVAELGGIDLLHFRRERGRAPNVARPWARRHGLVGGHHGECRAAPFPVRSTLQRSRRAFASARASPSVTTTHTSGPCARHPISSAPFSAATSRAAPTPSAAPASAAASAALRAAASLLGGPRERYERQQHHHRDRHQPQHDRHGLPALVPAPRGTSHLDLPGSGRGRARTHQRGKWRRRYAVSSSAERTGATDATVSPSPRFMTRTPVASRPCEEIPRTSIRMRVPTLLMTKTSSSSPTMKAATTWPFLAVSLMPRTP